MHRQSPLPVWGRQGRVRDWFHTKQGARFLNAQTSWFRLYTPKGFAVLSTVGRRTGKMRRTNVRLIVRGDKGFLVSIGAGSVGWLQNVRARPHVELRIGRTTRTGRARPPSDEQEVLEAIQTYCETVNWFDYVEGIVNQRGRPTAARIRSMHARWCEQGLVIVVDLDGSAA
jgi:deazaflavin-dependent oxidoreductase (nitroreductase family)